MKKVGIIGLGSYVPKRHLTNADLESMVDTSDEWITTRTGIKERRLADEKEATSDMAIIAAKKALQQAGIQPSQLGLILVATVTPDMPFPATSCIVQQSIDAPEAICFDINAACSGFIYSLVCAQQFIAGGITKYALVIGAEKLSAFTDWKDRSTCVLFGDGAGAAVLSPVRRGGILSSFLGSTGSLWELLQVPAGGSRLPANLETVNKRLHFIKMQGNEVFKHAVRYMVNAAHKALEQVGLTCKDIACFIPHQANIRILYAVAKKLGLSDQQLFLNIERYGNMSAASTAVALCEAVESGRIKKNDIFLLDAFGAGLVYGACVIQR
jgi:3-oxoacyl-[acyl-carrier-protein] synthase-3